MTNVNMTGLPSTDGYTLLRNATVRASNVAALRHRIRDLTSECGMDAQQVDGFAIAVNEVMTNAVCHGGGTGQLRLWSAGRAVCAVDDHCPGCEDGTHLHC